MANNFMNTYPMSRTALLDSDGLRFDALLSACLVSAAIWYALLSTLAM